MKFALFIFTFLFAVSIAGAQSVEELQQQLKEATDSKARMSLNFQLGDKLLRDNSKAALDYAKTAYNLSVQLNNNGMSAQSAYLTALAYERLRDDRNTEVWMKSALNFAKQAGDSDLIIKSVEKRSQMAMKDKNYRRAYEINQEAFTFFSGKGNSISELEAKFEQQKQQLAREKRELEKQKDKLEFDILNLRNERDEISKEKVTLESKQVELIRSNERKQEEIGEKESALQNVAEEKAKVEEIVKEQETKVKSLTRVALEQKAITTAVELEAEKSKLLAEQSLRQVEESIYLRNLLIAIASIVFLLALLFYSRYRAKRKSANSLTEKNKEIEEAHQHSENLLLNILPASIATELKSQGKAKARKYDEVTVLFTDFKNFTQISEQLSPEELVEVLDTCFKHFDFIIGQFPDVEKIKTIGDAYMCASGLSERRVLPHNIIRAALEMQLFMEEHKQERMRLGKPYFEARIGLHTGPVVAGVVGVKKFAYDIWGDTVNIAARMEANGVTGRVNVSETTYQLIRYKFHTEYRGKVEAKNKGLIDMHFVNKELAGVPVEA